MKDETLDSRPAHEALGARALSKLRWRCRRGLLENDLFIARFFEKHENDITVAQARGLYTLMELADNDLMDILLKRVPPDSQIDEPEAHDVLQLLWN
ncbi:MAG: succinate dehydrogenase assembly factor 2 [Limnohabitans sp.]|nr:succinate dehydrogenase assembly factor 2 [Limnohabitans sp.]